MAEHPVTGHGMDAFCPINVLMEHSSYECLQGALEKERKRACYLIIGSFITV